jgi:hypothetical protein
MYSNGHEGIQLSEKLVLNDKGTKTMEKKEKKKKK